MTTKTRRVLFRATIACGLVLPWLTILGAALAFDTPFADAFHPLTAVLPLLPVSVVLIAAWWSLPFVVFAFLWYRLATAEWEPLRQHLLLILLGIPVVMSQMGATESVLAALYLLLYLVYAMVAVPSWGLRSSIGRIVLILFALLALLLFTLLTYGFFVALGTEQLGQLIAAPLGVLFYMTMALFVGYLFAKPIDLLVCRGEPLPEIAGRPAPSDWLIGGNALACGLGFIGVMLLYSTLIGGTVTRHEISQFLAAQPLMLTLSALSVGIILGLLIYLVSFAMLRKGKYRQDSALLVICLAILPGFLTGIAPGLLGERVLLNILQSNYMGTYFYYGAESIDKIAVSPDGSRIAADAAGRLVIWDVASGDLVIDARSESWEVGTSGEALAWSPDSSVVSVTAPDYGITILDGHTGGRVLSLVLPGSVRPGPAVIGTVFSHDGRQLFVAGSENSIYVYELKGGKLEHTWRSPVPTRNLTAITLSPDGRRLAVAGVSSSDSNPSGGFIAVLDSASGESLYFSDDFQQISRQLSYSPDGSQLLLAGYDNPPRIIDAFTGSPLLELRHHCPPPSAPHAMSPFYTAYIDSHRVAIACQGGVAQICDTSGGDCRILFDLQLSSVNGLAAHPNGRHVAFLEQGRAITLWDSRTAEPWRSYRLP